MCTKCAVKTPVGYRCKQCVREQQDKFFNAQVLDYMIAAGVSLVISFFAAAILSRYRIFSAGVFPVAGGGRRDRNGGLAADQASGAGAIRRSIVGAGVIAGRAALSAGESSLDWHLPVHGDRRGGRAFPPDALINTRA